MYIHVGSHIEPSSRRRGKGSLLAVRIKCLNGRLRANHCKCLFWIPKVRLVQTLTLSSVEPSHSPAQACIMSFWDLEICAPTFWVKYVVFIINNVIRSKLKVHYWVYHTNRLFSNRNVLLLFEAPKGTKNFSPPPAG